MGYDKGYFKDTTRAIRDTAFKFMTDIYGSSCFLPDEA